MPKRTNDFQRLVYLIRLNLAGEAKVTESAMLRDRHSGRKREVDVSIEGVVGSHPVRVCVECRDHTRVADVGWIDAMKAKHERLDTNALILASRSGFTPEARDIARAYGIQTFTLEEIESTDFTELLGDTSELWLKEFSVTADIVTARVAASSDLPSETVKVMPDNLLYNKDGKELCQFHELVTALLGSKATHEYFLREGTGEHQWAELKWEPPSDQLGNALYMKKMEPEILRPLEAIRIIGPCKIDVCKFGLRRSKLGDVQLAWGKAVLRDKSAFAVATVSASGERKLSVNFTPLPPLPAK